MAFDRIYFDTSILIAEGWPRLSAKLENVLQLAYVLKVGLFLPQAVELELEEHWLRQFNEKCANANSKVQDLKKYIDVVTDDSVTLILPDRSRALSNYQDKVQTLKEK